MSKILAIGLALSLGAAAVLGWLLKNSYERNGELENANAALTESLKAKEQATRGRAQTQQKVRQMAPAEKLERLK